MAGGGWVGGCSSCDTDEQGRRGAGCGTPGSPRVRCPCPAAAGEPARSCFPSGEKNERQPDDKLLKAKPQKPLKERLVTPTRKEMGKNNKTDIKMLEMTKKKKIRKIKGHPSGKGKNFLPPMLRGRLLPSRLWPRVPGDARPCQGVRLPLASGSRDHRVCWVERDL